jgi:hypothetical protein
MFALLSLYQASGVIRHRWIADHHLLHGKKL